METPRPQDTFSSLEGSYPNEVLKALALFPAFARMFIHGQTLLRASFRDKANAYERTNPEQYRLDKQTITDKAQGWITKHTGWVTRNSTADLHPNRLEGVDDFADLYGFYEILEQMTDTITTSPPPHTKPLIQAGRPTELEAIVAVLRDEDSPRYQLFRSLFDEIAATRLSYLNIASNDYGGRVFTALKQHLSEHQELHGYGGWYDQHIESRGYHRCSPEIKDLEPEILQHVQSYQDSARILWTMAPGQKHDTSKIQQDA